MTRRDHRPDSSMQDARQSASISQHKVTSYNPYHFMVSCQGDHQRPRNNLPNLRQIIECKVPVIGSKAALQDKICKESAINPLPTVRKSGCGHEEHACMPQRDVPPTATASMDPPWSKAIVVAPRGVPWNFWKRVFGICKTGQCWVTGLHGHIHAIPKLNLPRVRAGCT